MSIPFQTKTYIAHVPIYCIVHWGVTPTPLPRLSNELLTHTYIHKHTLNLHKLVCGRYKLYVWHFTDQKITFKELYQIMFLWIAKNKNCPRISRNDQRKSVNMYTDNTQYSIIKVRHFKRIPSIRTHRVLEVSNFLLLFFKQFRLLTQLKKRMKKSANLSRHN